MTTYKIEDVSCCNIHVFVWINEKQSIMKPILPIPQIWPGAEFRLDRLHIVSEHTAMPMPNAKSPAE